MTDADGLIAAAAAAPDDDLPRLVLADWLDEHDEPDRAAFVRAQVRLAQTPAWEPFAVFCRHHRPDWVSGQPWRAALPAFEVRGLEWHPENAFRRGLPWSLVVRDVTVFLEQAPRLFADWPIGQLHLPTATIDQWRAFVRGSWLPRVKSIRFYGTATPVEPVRALCDSPLATGIEEIVFEVASRPGMPEVLRGLFGSPLGNRLKSLGVLAIGSANADEMTEVLTAADVGLDRLWLIQYHTNELNVRALARSQAFRRAGRVDIRQSISTQENAHTLFEAALLNEIAALDLAWGTIRTTALSALWQSEQFPKLRSLALPHCGMSYTSVRAMSRFGLVDRLRNLDLADNRLGDGGLPALTAAWANLIELDLSWTGLTDDGAAHLLTADPPAGLTALNLDANEISEGMADRLRDHFGDAVIV